MQANRQIDRRSLPSPAGPGRVNKIGNGRPGDIRRGQSTYLPGMVISTVQHEPYSDDMPESLADSDNISRNKFGAVYSKYRKFIIVKRYKQHVVAFPIYTHGHTGLAGKWTSDEFAQVFDTRQRGQIRNKTQYEPLFVRPAHYYTHATDGWHVFHGNEYVRFTFPFPIKYDAKTIIEGTLEDDSFLYLLRLFQGIAPGCELKLSNNPTQDLERQRRSDRVVDGLVDNILKEIAEAKAQQGESVKQRPKSMQ